MNSREGDGGICVLPCAKSKQRDKGAYIIKMCICTMELSFDSYSPGEVVSKKTASVRVAVLTKTRPWEEHSIVFDLSDYEY